jgi:putative membrane protein
MSVKKFICTTALAAAGICLAAGPAFAQSYPSQRQPGQTPSQYPQTPNTQASNTNATQTQTAQPMTDKQFAMKAAQGNMAEVKMGQLAEEKGSNDSVKNFGRRMVEDHTKANGELKQAATRDNVTLPTDLDKHDQMVYNHLSKLSGDAFDRAYAKDMVSDHRKDITAFKQEAANGQDPDIKNFASSTVPTLEQHLDLAKEMQKSVAGTSSNSSGGSTK